MKSFAVKVRGFGVDVNGTEKLLWATESQADEIRRRFNDPELKGTMVTLGNTSFPISGVLYIEERDKERYDLPKYFLESVEQGKQLNPNN